MKPGRNLYGIHRGRWRTEEGVYIDKELQRYGGARDAEIWEQATEAERT